MNIINPRILIDSVDAKFATLKIEGFNDSYTVKAKKISNLNIFSRIKIWVKETFFEKKFVRLGNGDTAILAKITSLSRVLSLSREEIINAERNKSINELVIKALEAKHYGVTYADIVEFVEQESLEELHKREELADSLSIPLSELLDTDTLKATVEKARAVKARCDTTFARLDAMYEEVDGKLVTRNANNKMQLSMPIEALEEIKKVVLAVSQNFARSPEDVKEEVRSVAKDYRLLVQKSENDLKITGLFGKLLGKGGTGVALQAMDLSTGTWAAEDDAVVKLPIGFEVSTRQLIQEGAILGRIHSEGQVLGIQKPLRMVRDVSSGVTQYCHFGPRYEKDLFSVVSNKSVVLPTKHKLSMVYQLLFGISHMHAKNITHGDIKPENIFYNLMTDDVGPRLFLGDFGGAVDHSRSDLTEPTTTPTYRHWQDDQKSVETFNKRKLEEYRDVEGKADVFAASCVIYTIFTNGLPYDFHEKKWPGYKGFALNKDLLGPLTKGGLSEETAKLVIQGLDSDYTQRPDAETLLQAVKNELSEKDADLLAQLNKLAR